METKKVLKYISIAMIALGIAMLLHASYLAIMCFSYYRIPPIPTGLESALSATIGYVLDIVVRLAFLGLYIWIGTVLLSKGLDSLKTLSIEKR